MDDFSAATIPTIDEFRGLLEEQPYERTRVSDERMANLDCCELSGCATCASCSSCHTA